MTYNLADLFESVADAIPARGDRRGRDGNPMRRLAGQDAFFLYRETPKPVPTRILRIVPLPFETSENPLFVTDRSPSGPNVIEAG